MVHVLAICDVNSPKGATIKRRLEALGIEYSLSPAVFPAEPCPWSPHYNEKKRMLVNGYGMVKGEVGCFLAHREAWKIIARGERDYVLIIEDDAEIAAEDLDAINNLPGLIETRSVITLLFADYQLSFRQWIQSKRVSIVLPTTTAYSTMAYLISKQTAMHLLAASESFYCPVDDFLNMQHLHGTPLVHTYPFLAKQDGAASSIGSRPKPRISNLKRLIRNYYRFVRKLRDVAYRIKTRFSLGLIFAKVETPTNHV